MINTKKIWYLLAAMAVILITTVALMSNKKEVEKTPKNPYQAIDGAKTNSYEPVGESLELTTDDNVIGNKKAELIVFVYEDYSSPYSAVLAETLSRINSELDNKLTIAIRPFVTAGNNISREGALTLMCAQDEGKFSEMRNVILTAAKEGSLQEGGFNVYANQLGIDETAFNNCLTNEEKSLKLEAIMAEADKNLVIGAPTIFIANEMIIGARPYSDFVDSNGDAVEGLKAVVDRQLSAVGTKK